MGTMFRLTAHSVLPRAGARIIKAHELEVLVEAQSVLDEAKARVAAMEAKAAKDYEAKVQEGYEDGLMQGRLEQAEKMLETALSAVEYIEGIEETLVRVVSSAVRKTVGELDDKERIVRVVRNALVTVRGQQRVLVRVAPSDEAAVRDALAVMLQDAPGGVSFLDVQADPRLQAGSCLLESEMGVVDASLETQMQALERALASKLGR